MRCKLEVISATHAHIHCQRTKTSHCLPEISPSDDTHSLKARSNNKTQRSNDEFFFLSGSDRQTLSSVSVSLLPRAQARIAITTDADGIVGGIVDVAAVLFADVLAVVLAIFIIDSCCCC